MNNDVLTATDKLFDETKPSYYIYDRQVYKRRCYKCDKKFETRLELNVFCSPKCKVRSMSG